MKLNSTQALRCRYIIPAILLLFSTSSVIAQPGYDFRDATVISGVANEVGAVYQFNNVKPGVDARITITALTGGLWLTDLDGGGGFVEALQPVINIPPHSTGYAELQIDFFYSTTSDPYIQDEVPVTPIDIDGYYYGDGYLFEFDMISRAPSGYINFDGSSPEMHLSFANDWVTGTNTSGLNYQGIDTAARAIMFTIVNAHISTMIIRVGAINESSSIVQRLRSVYFKKFFFPNTVLPVSDIISFKGNLNDNLTKLKWSINTTDNKTVTLEKSLDARTFQSINTWSLDNIQGDKKEFEYTDQLVQKGRSFYRLKLVSNYGKIKYSNVIYFDNEKAAVSELIIYPSLFSNTITAQITAAKSETASIEVFNYSGKMVYKQSVSLAPGQNNIRIDKTDHLSSGIYICIARTSDRTYSTKVQKQ